MSVKEEFLKIKTYEEYDKRRDEFRGMDIMDKEIIQHLNDLYPTLDNSDFENGIIKEVYKYPGTPRKFE
jgi:hypothetical protein